MKKKLAILGASKSHMPLINKATEMGLETHCFAWDIDAYAKEYVDYFYDISITEKERIAEQCKEINIDGIVSNALEISVPTVAYVAEKLSLVGNSYETSINTTNKNLMREIVKNNNSCLQPKYIIYNKGDIINLNDLEFPLIVKPTASSCSNGVTKVTNSKDIYHAIERALSYSGNEKIIIEEFIDGDEISVEAISYQGKHYIITVTDKETTGEPYFVEIGHHQPSKYTNNIEIINNIRDTVNNLLNSLNVLNGASHTELKITKDNKIFFIELGTRGGGDNISYNLVELSTGYDYVRAMIEVSLGLFVEPDYNSFKHNYSGILFISDKTSSMIEFVNKHKNDNWVVDYEIKDSDIFEVKKSQDRLGYIMYKSNSRIEKYE